MRAYEDERAHHVDVLVQGVEVPPPSIASLEYETMHVHLDFQEDVKSHNIQSGLSSDLRQLQVEMCSKLVKSIDNLGISDISRVVRCAYGRPPAVGVQSMQVYPRPALPFLCPSCLAYRTYNSVESQLSCPMCGVSVYYPDGTEGRNSQAIHAGSACTTGSSGGYDRIQLYRKHLEQYADSSFSVPDEVIDQVRQSLQALQLTRSNKCRPTLITKILKETRLGQWCKHSLRICRRICGKPSSELQPKLIDLLMARFNIILKVYNRDSAQRGKFLNFDFLTKQFLCMEGYYEEASLFSLNKTKEVELRAEGRLAVLCELALAETSDTSWKVTPTEVATGPRRIVMTNGR